MGIMSPTNLCICHHTHYEHYNSGDYGCSAYIVAGNWCGCKTFQLDNLAYIESVAQKKGLV